MHRAWQHYWLCVATLGMALPLPAYLVHRQETPLQRPLSELPYAVGGWRGRDELLSDRTRALLGTDDLLQREYVNDQGQAVWLYVSYFAQQQQGQGSHSPKNCLPGAGWQPLWARRVPDPVAGDGAAMINEILYEKEGRRQLVFYWFHERERIVASEYLVKWYLMWDAMTRHRTDGALLRVSTPVESSEEDSRQRAVDFMRFTLPRLNAFFPN